MIAFYLASRMTPEQLFRYLFQLLSLIVILSFAVALLAPDIGQMGYRGNRAWTGFFSHKTALGHTAVFALFCAWSAKRLRVAGALSTNTMIVISLVTVIFSKSAMSVAAIMLGLGVAAISNYIRRLRSNRERLQSVYMVFSLSFVCFLFALLGYSILAEIFNRDVTLSGRTNVWQFLWELTKERPILGFGYDAAWRSEGIRELFIGMRRWTPSAHNSFLQAWLETGVIGFFAFLYMCWTGLRNTIEGLVESKSLVMSCILTIISTVLFVGVLESSLFKTQQINYTIFMVLLFSATYQNKAKGR